MASNPTYKPSLFAGRIDPEKVAPLLDDSAAKFLAAAVALLVLIRPNLVPVAAIMAGWLMLRAWKARPGERMGWLRRAVLFSCAVAPAAVVVAAINSHLYGSPLRNGYGALGDLFAWTNVPINLRYYTRIFIETQTVFALLGVVALGCFVLGVLVGRGLPTGTPVTETAPRPSVLSGKVSYLNREEETTPDVGAVAILLPQAKRPDEKLSLAGLLPKDAPPPADDPTLLALRSSGGGYARADADGRFASGHDGGHGISDL